MSEKVIYLIDPDQDGLFIGEGSWPIDPVLSEQKGEVVYADLNPLCAVAIAPEAHNAADDNCYWKGSKWNIRRQEKKIKRDAAEAAAAAVAAALKQKVAAEQAALIAVRNEYVTKLGLSVAAANTMAGLKIDTP